MKSKLSVEFKNTPWDNIDEQEEIDYGIGNHDLIIEFLPRRKDGLHPVSDINWMDIRN